MFGRDVQQTVTVAVSDPTADSAMPIWRVPAEITKIEILEAWAVSDTAVTLGNGTGIALRLLDYGAAGTSVAGTVTASLGGTAISWTAQVPKSFTVSDGTMDAGDYLVLNYDETGTVAPLNVLVSFTWVSGVGA